MTAEEKVPPFLCLLSFILESLEAWEWSGHSHVTRAGYLSLEGCWYTVFRGQGRELEAGT